MKSPADDPVTRLVKLLKPIELLRIAPMPESEKLSSLSEDTLRREHGDKIIKLSKRRDGMRVIDALMLGQQSDG